MHHYVEYIRGKGMPYDQRERSPPEKSMKEGVCEPCDRSIIKNIHAAMLDEEIIMCKK